MGRLFLEARVANGIVRKRVGESESDLGRKHPDRVGREECISASEKWNGEDWGLRRAYLRKSEHLVEPHPGTYPCPNARIGAIDFKYS
jgi:hypothetical protein